MFVLGKRSLASLQGVHPDLVRVVKRAIAETQYDFVVLEGVRTLERQKQLLAAGASRTLKSRHLIGEDGYGHAVDLGALVDGEVTWRTRSYYSLAPFVKSAASKEGVLIEWGGDWNGFADLVHYQLPTGKYP